MLRIALGLSQQELADLLHYSYGSIQGYEAGRAPTAEILERMVALALEHELGALASALQKAYGPEPAPEANTDREWHHLLDAILGSGNAAAIQAVKSNLTLCHQFAGGKVIQKRKAR
jgi:transcriptional regulator with XRE-family HTH domain